MKLRLQQSIKAHAGGLGWSMVLLLAAPVCVAPVLAKTQPSQSVPTPQAVLRMATGVRFSSIAVTDDPVPLEARRLNPKFRIAVAFRTSPYASKPSPTMGAVIARVMLRGVPKARGLPDGNYYLWIGGPDENMRAVLVSTDGVTEQQAEVLSKPSIAEETMPHSPRVHVVLGPVFSTASPTLPHPPFPPPPPRPRPPPPPPKPPPPPPRPSWREICVHPPSDHGGKRWVRVPDN
jgi:hypothetical protein